MPNVNAMIRISMPIRRPALDSAATTLAGDSSRWITVVTRSAYMNATAPALNGGNFPV